MSNRYWFRRKRFGWGLEPGTSQGWIATLLFFVVDGGGTFVLMPFVVRTHPWILIAWAFGWLAAFVALVVVKGEPLF